VGFRRSSELRKGQFDSDSPDADGSERCFEGCRDPDCINAIQKRRVKRHSTVTAPESYNKRDIILYMKNKNSYPKGAKSKQTRRQ